MWTQCVDTDLPSLPGSVSEAEEALKPKCSKFCFLAVNSNQDREENAVRKWSFRRVLTSLIICLHSCQFTLMQLKKKITYLLLQVHWSCWSFCLLWDSPSHLLCLSSAPEKLGTEGEEEVQRVREREGEGGGEEGWRGKQLCLLLTAA